MRKQNSRMTEATSKTNSGPTACHFFVAKKRRYCRLIPGKGNEFCGEHLMQEESSNINQNDNKLRIVCPKDPSHTCYKSRLKTHLKKCNSVKNIPNEEWYKENVNCAEDSNPQDNTNYFKTAVKDLPAKDIFTVICKVKDFNAFDVIKIQLNYHKKLVENIKSLEGNNSALKHLKQQASLLNIMDENKFLEKNLMFVEFGAGRGQMTDSIIETADLSSNYKFVLVDRGANRRKLDAKHRKEGNFEIKRIRVDIKDLNLGKLNEIQNENIVAISKHLCGPATDLTLTCLTRTMKHDLISGGVIALCCHHRCTWNEYIGKKLMNSLQINAYEFSILVKLTSWAVCKFPDKHKPVLKPNDIENSKNLSEISDTEKEQIGVKCKRLIDQGRINHLRELGFNVKLVEYTSSDISLENTAFVFKNTTKNE